jgi:aminopeptidase N
MKQQSFSLAVDSKPLLVNFDYHGTLIKELEFDKTTEDLAYQLSGDEDVLGRVWALGQLQARAVAPTTSDAEKRQIAENISNAVNHDKFWGVRVNAAAALADLKTPSARAALIAATSDPDARVRARAVGSLASSKDALLASLYTKLLSDQSYAVIKAAALALGETSGPGAYEALRNLVNVPSWRDNIRASALAGLGELSDKRALEIALRYAVPGNPRLVRAAALRLLGKVGADDPRAFKLIAETGLRAFESNDFTLALATGDALVSLGEPRGLAVLEQIAQNPEISGQLKIRIGEYQELLKKSVAATPNRGSQHP